MKGMMDAPAYKNPLTYPEPWLIPGSLRPLYRFLLGRPMDNIIRTNATFWHAATEGYPSRWLRLPGWKRAAIRVLALYVLVSALGSGLAYLLGVSLTPFLVANLTALGTPVCLLLAARLVRDYGIRIMVPVFGLNRARLRFEGWGSWEIEGRKHWDRQVIQPLAAAVAGVLGTAYRPAHAGRWVQVPRGFREPNGSPVSIHLPLGFTGADRGTCDRLVRTVSARLGLRDPEVRWELEGDAPRVLLSAPPVPPRLVTYADMARHLEASQEYRPVLGLAARGSALCAEMIADSPHIALSAGSGAGKSELVKLIVMQALRWGWGVVILDWKEVSQEWAEGLPGVRIVRDIGDIHEWLVRLGEDLETRKRSYRQDPTLPGRSKVLVVYEEMNITADLLAAYWQDLRSTEPDPEVRRSMPLKSPALRAQNALIFGGRQFGIHLLCSAQRFSARVMQGNADLRDNFGIRLMARYFKATVAMLAPDIKPFPKAPSNLGAWVAVMHGDAVVFQAPLIATEEAREYALGGVENPDHPLTVSHGTPLTYRQGMDSELGESLGHDPAPALAGTVVGMEHTFTSIDKRRLSDMVDGLAHLGITLDVLRNEVKRDPMFPQPIGGSPNRGWEYDFAAVLEWARKRHARQQAERRAA